MWCREPLSDATYAANSHVLLHDDSCFRFAAVSDSKATIQLIEPDKTEVPPGASFACMPGAISCKISVPIPSVHPSSTH